MDAAINVQWLSDTHFPCPSEGMNPESAFVLDIRDNAIHPKSRRRGPTLSMPFDFYRSIKFAKVSNDRHLDSQGTQ